MRIGDSRKTAREDSVLKWEFLDRAATGGVRLRFRYSEELVRHVGLGKREKTRQGRGQTEDRLGRENRLGGFRVGTCTGHHRVGMDWKQAPRGGWG